MFFENRKPFYSVFIDILHSTEPFWTPGCKIVKQKYLWSDACCETPSDKLFVPSQAATLNLRALPLTWNRVPTKTERVLWEGPEWQAGVGAGGGCSQGSLAPVSQLGVMGSREMKGPQSVWVELWTFEQKNSFKETSGWLLLRLWTLVVLQPDASNNNFTSDVKTPLLIQSQMNEAEREQIHVV